MPVASSTAVPTSSTTSTPSMVSGLPAPPTPTTRPSRTPIDAYRTRRIGSRSRPPTIATSTPPRSARTPRPSRMVLPKPGTSWSGPWTSSRCATTRSAVSPRRTASATDATARGAVLRAAIALLARGRQRRLAGARRVQRAVDELAVAAHHARAADRDQRDLARLAGREEHLGARRHREAHAPRRRALEAQHRVDLEEVHVAGHADEDRSLVEDLDPCRGALQPRHFGLTGGGRPPGRRPERVLDDDEVPAVAEDRLDLDPRDERPHALQDVVLAQDVIGLGHDLGVAQAVAGQLADAVGDDRGRLGLVEPQAALAAPSRELGGEEEQQAVLLLGQQPHRLAAYAARARRDGRRSGAAFTRR